MLCCLFCPAEDMRISCKQLRSCLCGTAGLAHYDIVRFGILGAVSDGPS